MCVQIVYFMITLIVGQVKFEGAFVPGNSMVRTRVLMRSIQLNSYRRRVQTVQHSVSWAPYHDRLLSFCQFYYHLYILVPFTFT